MVSAVDDDIAGVQHRVNIARLGNVMGAEIPLCVGAG